ncbi:hypothetical protein [Gynuella sunshinyii]|uniref:Uncharacterized protein n=1 Tax=Gynuella sunshinyii YC6258 TaxID=1445510 RepID=A0A0C5VEZ4_9GAMM|nr:hypothetical protein [Gynuella sunshinyii]AJQ97820.1 hypothetical Protein YC6258_05792 [Gynuella sunshinyii YC6258]
MSETDKKPEDRETNTADEENHFEGVSPLEAAAAAVAQSIAFSAQNEVDGFKSQSTIDMVVIGSAYAKWLQNPGMGEEFNKIIGSVRTDEWTVPNDRQNKIIEGSTLVSAKLGRQIFNQYFDLKK